jgi:nitric oxide reductase activation protein
MSSLNSSAVELAPIREMLRLYCRALTERGVDVRDLKSLIDKNIGWSREDAATGDGSAIFLPAVIDRFETASENFAFLKVMLTQQAGHLEFGSFAFQFDRPSTQFDDLRLRLTAAPEYHEHDHGHEGHYEPSSLPDFTRFFRLFPGRRLALDIFSLVESGRIEARVTRSYRGVAKLYDEMRRRTLMLRPEMTLLPAREALLEFIVRLSLGQESGLKVPRRHLQSAQEIHSIMDSMLRRQTTVEDAAEATLRIYARLAAVKNDYPGAEPFTPFRSDERNGRNAAGPTFRNTGAPQALPRVVGRDRDYMSPPAVDYRGEFRPELAQLLSPQQANAREERKALTAEELADLLRAQRTPKRRDAEEEGDQQDPQTDPMVQNLMRELERRHPRMQSVEKRGSPGRDEDEGALTASQPNTYVYDEWDVFSQQYRRRWCKVYESAMTAGHPDFYRDTLLAYRGLSKQIRGEFEQVAPELYRKEKRLPDGTEHDLDLAIEALIDLRIGLSPSERIFWRQFKLDRDVTVAFLLDMSGSTGESIGKPGVAAPPEEGHEEAEGSPRRIIDVEKEAMVLMCNALETIGDRYGIYGFSGHGRDHVEFFVIKDIGEEFNLEIAKRFDRIGPLHATRMGPAIRHTTMKLAQEPSRAKFLFLISDGRPQDRGYSQESSEKAYALHDTRMAMIEARRLGIHPFCLTVDKDGNDYLRTMMDDFSYEVLPDVRLLPHRLPQLYRKLTF